MKRFLGECLSPEEEENSPMVSMHCHRCCYYCQYPQCTTNVPEVQSVLKAMPEEKAPKFARWEKILHPSQLVLATGEIPQPSTMPKGKGNSLTTHSNDPYKPTTLLIEGPVTTAISPTSKSIGIKAATHSAPRLCQNNGLPENTRSCGSRPERHPWSLCPWGW